MGLLVEIPAGQGSRGMGREERVYDNPSRKGTEKNLAWLSMERGEYRGSTLEGMRHVGEG